MYSQDWSIPDLLSSTSHKSKSCGSKPLDLFRWDKRERVETPDFDFFHIDYKTCSKTKTEPLDTRPIVLICHGLQASSESPIAQEMAMAFNNIQFDAQCMNFRGCSGESNLSPRSYHVGFTDDLLYQISRINKSEPSRRIYLAGFSLGAGVVTKILAELGEDASTKHNICGAAVNAVPFDLAQCAHCLNQDGLSKRLYGDRLLKSMKDRLHEQYDSVEFPFARDDIDKCKSIMDVENILIAATFGFKDAWDYYEKSKTNDLLDRICVPEYVVQALDDPFFEGLENPEIDTSYAVNIHYTRYGGHCGYIFSTEKQDDTEISWMPTQLARFLAHVDKNLNAMEEANDKMITPEKANATR
eukprot:scaffold710_cov171-Amphora_coffeaeformis.AAC.13